MPKGIYKRPGKKYPYFEIFHTNDLGRDKLNELKRKTQINKSVILRSLIDYFSENYLQLLIILEEMKIKW